LLCDEICLFTEVIRYLGTARKFHEEQTIDLSSNEKLIKMWNETVLIWVSVMVNKQSQDLTLYYTGSLQVAQLL